MLLQVALKMKLALGLEKGMHDVKIVWPFEVQYRLDTQKRKSVL